jgi:hypothetical protein
MQTIPEIIDGLEYAGLVGRGRRRDLELAIREAAFNLRIQTTTDGRRFVPELGGTVHTFVPRVLTEDEADRLLAAIRVADFH